MNIFCINNISHRNRHLMKFLNITLTIVIIKIDVKSLLLNKSQVRSLLTSYVNKEEYYFK